jgi:hypothetical protein
MEPTEIEVFRAGTRASRGITPEQIAEVAAFDCDANPIGVCFGHPKSDDPAAGTIQKFRADGHRLFATVKSFTQKAVDGIKSGEWINRSMAFFHPEDVANPTPGKWAPRHLGLLGASAPGIPGMGSLQKALAFAADGETLIVEGDPAAAWVEEPVVEPTPVIFTAPEAQPEPHVMEFTAEQIAENTRLKAEADKLKADRLAFEAEQTTAFAAGNASIVSGLVAAGKVLPNEADKLKLVFNAFGRDPIEFSATDKATPASALAAFLDTALPKRLPIGDRTSPSVEFTAPEAGSDWKAQADQIEAKARAKMATRPSLDFAAAVEEVENETRAAS